MRVLNVDEIERDGWYLYVGQNGQQPPFAAVIEYLDEVSGQWVRADVIEPC